MEKPSYLAVTAYYNLSKNDPYFESGQGRTDAQYLEHGVSILSLKCPMMIFCEEENESTIKQIREKHAPDQFTKVVVRPWSSLPKYKHFNIMTERRNKIKGKYSGGYYMLVNSKVDFMLGATGCKEYDFFIWIDFGIKYLCNVDPSLVDKWQILSKKVNFRNQWINPLPSYKEMISNFDEYFGKPSGTYVFATAGCWMGNREMMTKFCQKANYWFDFIIKEKTYICLEEPIYTIATAEILNEASLNKGEHESKSSVSPYTGRYVNTLESQFSLFKDDDLYFIHIKSQTNPLVIESLMEYGLMSLKVSLEIKLNIVATMMNRIDDKSDKSLSIETVFNKAFCKFIECYMIIHANKKNNLTDLYDEAVKNRWLKPSIL